MRKYGFEIFIAIVEIALLILQLVDSISLKFFSDTNTAFRQLLAAQVAILIIYTILRLSAERSALHDIGTRINDIIGCKAVASAINQEDFYSRYNRFMTSANHFVGVTHLAKTPPNPMKCSVQELYYKSFFNLVKKRSNVAVHRVERATKEKREWLERIVRELKGRKNFSLFCILTNDSSEFLPSISVQIVDDKHTFLVAVSKHDNHGGNRDIYIQDREVTEIWRAYFDRQLVKNSIAVIRDGTLDEVNWAKVKEEIGA